MSLKSGPVGFCACLLIVGWLLASPLAIKGQVTLNTNITITADNKAFEGKDVIITHCTVLLDGPHQFNSLWLQPGGIVGYSSGGSNLVISLTRDLVVDSGGRIGADGLGYGANVGPGRGVPGGSGSGAGHGGLGGDVGNGTGDCYDSPATPEQPGSGGASGDIRGNYGASDDPIATGGAGGGAIRIAAGGRLRVDGIISANGGGGKGYIDSIFGPGKYAGGGGAGSTIYLTAGSLEGNGTISAGGGDAGWLDHGGGGGGGMVALYCTTNLFSGVVVAAGGAGAQQGGAGTIYSKSGSQSWGRLLVDNLGHSGAPTLLRGSGQVFDTLLIQGGAQLLIPTNVVMMLESPELTLGPKSYLTIIGQVLCAGQTGGKFLRVQVLSSGTLSLKGTNALAVAELDVLSGGTVLVDAPQTFSSVDVASNGVVTCELGVRNVNFTVNGNMTVHPGGLVIVDGLGFAGGLEVPYHQAAQGPGAGRNQGDGGGYGGRGGSPRSGVAGGLIYGSLTQPTDWGSGGAAASFEPGGAGGGAIQLLVTGTLSLNGRVSAAGLDGAGEVYVNGLWTTFGVNGGGGSGGSIWLTASNLVGVGGIAANGGSSPWWNSQGGGGGGGRVALYFSRNTFSGTISAMGGNGVQSGQSGTIYTTYVSGPQPTIAWSNPVPIIYGTPLGPNQLNATTDVPGHFVYSPVAGTVLNAGNAQPLTVVWYPSNTVDYAAVTNTVFVNVDRAPLAVMTTDTKRLYGAPNPAFIAGYSGFTNGDTAAVVTGQPDFTTPAVKSSPVGTYPITPLIGTLNAANYMFTAFSNGTLTVMQGPLTVAANSGIKAYGQAVPPAGFGFTAIGLLNGDTVTNVTLTSTGFAASALVSGSPYLIVPSAALGTGLSNYTIRYTDGALTVLPALPFVPGTNSATTVPSHPMVSEITTTSARINWGASTSSVGDPLYYEVQYWNLGNPSQYFVTNSTNTSLGVTGLLPETTYRVILKAIDSTTGLWSAWSSTTDFTTAAVLEIAGMEARISWLPATNSSGHPLYYEVQYWNPNDLSQYWVVPKDTSTWLDVTGLQARTTYRVLLKAIDAATAVPSAWSPTTDFRLVNITRPGQPTVMQLTQTSAQISWSASASAVGHSLYYEVQYWNLADSSQYWVVPKVTNTVLVVNGLSSQTPYRVILKAIDSTTGTWSAWSSTTDFRLVDITVPGAPVVTQTTSTGTVIAWTASANFLGHPLNYEVQYWNLNDASQYWLVPKVTGTSLVANELRSQTPYRVLLKAIDGATGAWSAWSPTTDFSLVDITVPGTPVARQTTATSAEIGWEGSTNYLGHSLYYEVQYWSLKDPSDYHVVPKVTAGTLDVTGLQMGTPYRVILKAIDSTTGLWSAWSGTTDFTLVATTAPGQPLVSARTITTPGQPVVTQVTGSSAHVSWSGSTDVWGRPLYYEVQYWNLSNTAQYWVVPVVTNTWLDVVGLQPGTTYRLILKAIDSVTGTWSDWSLTTDFQTSAGQLAAVSPVALTHPRLAGSTFSLTVSTRGEYRYILEYKNAHTDADWTPVQTVNGNGSSMTLSDPDAAAGSRLYRVRVEPQEGFQAH